MTATTSERLRRLWLDVHLWIGVGLLVLIIPVSISGAILVWHDPLERVLHPERFAVSEPASAEQPLSAYAGAAQAAFAGRANLTQLRLPQEPGDPVVAMGRQNGAPGPNGRPRNLTAWIDPGDGRVLAVADTSGSFVQVMHRLHGSLLLPKYGRQVVGWLGVAMFVSCLTGLWLWLPRNGAVLKALRWRRSPSTMFNLHHMLGFWICVPLAVLSLTGVYISFPQTARAIFAGGPAPKAQTSGPRRFPPPIPRPALSIDDAAAKAQATQPDARIASVSTPTKGKAPAWRVQFAAEGSGPPKSVQVVDGTGEVKGGGGPGGGPDPTARLMRRIHDGVDMGFLWQAIIFLAGVIPPVLSITGVVMWLRRRKRRRALGGGLARA